MRAFIDTSALFKKYCVEDGSAQLEGLLETIDEIIVAPTYLLESHSVVKRLMREGVVPKRAGEQLTREIEKDAHFFNRIVWHDELEKKALDVVDHYAIKSLDAIQLAAGVLARPDIFITSDKQLARFARKEKIPVEVV